MNQYEQEYFEALGAEAEAAYESNARAAADYAEYEAKQNAAIVLSPNNIPVLSKQNAATFHQMVKERIFETGEGLFEYVETIKFFAALDKQISGDSTSNIKPDREFIDYLREQIKLKGEKEKLLSARGVKFENAEVGTSYDFSNCGDTALEMYETAELAAKNSVKERKEFLKTVPKEGLIVTDPVTGETTTIFPPTKTSKSSFKITLPK